MFAYAFERTYTRCFLVKNVRENENDAAKNQARYLSGVVTLAILIGSSARWILGIFTSTDDIDKLRTQQLWWFLQGVILANTIREVILGSVILFLTGHLQAKDRVGFAVSAVLNLAGTLPINRLGLTVMPVIVLLAKGILGLPLAIGKLQVVKDTD